MNIPAGLDERDAYADALCVRQGPRHRAGGVTNSFGPVAPTEARTQPCGRLFPHPLGRASFALHNDQSQWAC